MKKLLLAAGLLFSGMAGADAQSSCTLVVDAATGEVLAETGDVCAERFPPASTFKVALALMGFDSGLLVDVENPAWPYREEYGRGLESWRQTTGPARWLSESVLWYSRVLVAEMGEERFAAYAAALDYGNADVSGDPGAGNGMTRSWLNSSLQISPAEQVAFLRRLLLRELPVSAAAQDMTQSVMPPFTSGGWSVWGKTGSTRERDAEGNLDPDRQLGWFVGWAERGEDTVVFASFLRDGQKVEGDRAGLRVRDSLLADLPALVGR
jgi:beta-lactamase class D